MGLSGSDTPNYDHAAVVRVAANKWAKPLLMPDTAERQFKDQAGEVACRVTMVFHSDTRESRATVLNGQVLFAESSCCGDTMSEEAMKAELERLRQENAALKTRPARGVVSLKVSEKGGLSVYGLGRFPVTLYKEQWVKLLDAAEDIRTFLKENDATLKAKE